MKSVTKHTFDNIDINVITLDNGIIKASFLDYGATILNIETPDKNGKREKILIEYNNIETYINNEMYLNATVGPFSGRIKDSSFSIDDKHYSVDKNFKETVNLHGGKETISYKSFDFKAYDNKVVFTYNNQLDQTYFPGKQLFTITYTLNGSTLLIEFEADTTKDTLVNLTNHAYFNLSGNLKSDVMEHEVSIKSSKTLELDEKFCPIKVKESIDTHLDFRKNNTIKSHFYDGIYDSPDNGIDNPLLLDEVDISIPQVTLKEPVSKRVMNVYTTYPCIVCYTHNYPDKLPLIYNVEHKKHMGICFETQFEPNGINVEGLSSSILRKGNHYYEKTLLEFLVEED